MKIVSFGFRHGKPQTSEIIDVRILDNPFEVRALRSLNGLDPRVQAHVRKTRNFDKIFEVFKKAAASSHHEVVYVGCTGGHHRSVFVAEQLSKDLGVPVEHRDIDKP